MACLPAPHWRTALAAPTWWWREPKIACSSCLAADWPSESISRLWPTFKFKPVSGLPTAFAVYRYRAIAHALDHQLGTWAEDHYGAVAGPVLLDHPADLVVECLGSVRDECDLIEPEHSGSANVPVAAARLS